MSTVPDPYARPTDPHTAGSGADVSGVTSPGASTGATRPGPDVAQPTSPGAGSTDAAPAPSRTSGGTGTGAPDVPDVPDTGASSSGAGRGPAAGRHGDPEGLSLGELFAEVSRDLSALVRQEVELAKAEAMTSAKRAGKGAGLLGGAGYAAHLAVLFLTIAIWWALGHLIGLGWSALVVAVLWGIVAAVLAARGRREVKATPGMDQTADSLKKIPNALQGNEEKNR
jgi:hypothetical protein